MPPPKLARMRCSSSVLKVVSSNVLSSCCCSGVLVASTRCILRRQVTMSYNSNGDASGSTLMPIAWHAEASSRLFLRGSMLMWLRFF